MLICSKKKKSMKEWETGLDKCIAHTTVGATENVENL